MSRPAKRAAEKTFTSNPAIVLLLKTVALNGNHDAKNHDAQDESARLGRILGLDCAAPLRDVADVKIEQDRLFAERKNREELMTAGDTAPKARNAIAWTSGPGNVHYEKSKR